MYASEVAVDHPGLVAVLCIAAIFAAAVAVILCVIQKAHASAFGWASVAFIGAVLWVLFG